MTQTKDARQIRAQELHDLVRTKTRDQVVAILDIGKALLELYNEDLWKHLEGYRSWKDYCERAADLTPTKADRYIDLFVVFGDINIAEHEYVGITKLQYLRRIAVNKSTIRQGLREAKDRTCEDFKSWVAAMGKELRKKGLVVRPISERHTQVNIIFEPEEKIEFRQVLERIKSEMDIHLNGQAALEMARFWKRHHNSKRRAQVKPQQQQQAAA